jgi:sugar O-acyltransferase (sialic acid O-acetyltransferase NeuD family)
MRDSKQTKILGLYGAGGFAREVMPIAVELFSMTQQASLHESYGLYFIETTPTGTEVNGYPLLSEDDFFQLKCEERFFNIAVADSKLREEIAGRCTARGAQPMSLQSANSVSYDNNDIGEGAIICAFSTITSNARIGKFFHSNIYSYVAHDCVIGDYVTFAPNVHCNGNVHIGNHAYIGTGAIIKQGSAGRPLVIGQGAIVGMGAVVTKDVAPYTTVVGNPARLHTKG